MKRVMFMALIHWQELERYTTWALSKSYEPEVSWDEGADGWQLRIDFETNFTQAQVDACTRITKDTTVLDACCGTGRTAIPFAKKAKKVYALDGGEHMLEHCRRNAEAEGLDNVEIVKVGNWHNCEPGKEIPVADIAVSVIGPPQADAVKFSRCATQYCYFLSFTKDPYRFVMKELFDGCNSEWERRVQEGRPGGPGRPGMPGLRGPGGVPLETILGGKPHGNPVNLNVQFNLLYSLGALPTVTYADGAWEHTAATKEDVYHYLRKLGHVDEDREEVFRSNVDKRLVKTEEGLWRYAYESQMYVLGWDPRELDWDAIENAEKE